MCLICGLIINLAFDKRFGAASAIEKRLDPSFTLVDQNGNAFTNGSIANKPRVILFGYTECADVCPTTISALAGDISRLGGSTAGATFVFMTVDPEHDTPSRLKAYLEQFSPKVVGLTGEPMDVRNVLGAYGVYRNQRSDGLIDHSSFVLLIDADGILRDRIPESQLGRDAALSKLRRLVGAFGHDAIKEKKGAS
jgi:protein SCO1/2